MKKLLSTLALLALVLACIFVLPTRANAASSSDLTFSLNEDGKSYSVTDCKESANGSLTIPSTYNGKTVTTIADFAFSGCSNLTSITVPDSVTTIGNFAFQKGYSLKTVTLGNGLNTIGYSAFMSCMKLTNLTIPANVSSIGGFAFADCSGLTSVTIGSGVTTIDSSAFSGCTSVTDVYYIGNKEQWNKISIGRDNSALTDATIHYAQYAKITKQPTSVTVSKGATAKVSLTATGDGITYTWYYKNKGASSYTKSSTTTNTYSTTMDATRNGRSVYCVVKDKYGNSVKSSVVTLSMKKTAKITKQPANVTVASGATAKTTVTATGDGVTYTWYFKNKGASNYSKSSTTTNTYSMTMDSTKDGRQVYCVVKDKYGNSVKSSVVTLSMKKTAKITKQPANASAVSGATVKTSLTATGDDVTYTWYFKNKGASSYTKSSITTNTYSMTMDSTRAGRQVYCVIKDKYGNSVKSNVVTLSLKTVAKITKQPTDVKVANGASVKTSLSAVGDGLTYTWYFKNKTATTWTQSSITTNTYTMTMDANRDGRKVYCVVKDKYGNSVTSNIATLSMKVTTSKLTIGIPVNANVLEYENNALTKYLEKETGIDLEFVLFADGSEIGTHISVCIAVGQPLPDILWGCNLNDTFVSQIGQDGYLADLSDYFADAEGASKTFWDRVEEELTPQQIENLKRQMIDPENGGVYAVPTVETTLVNDIDYQVWINTEWLDALNLDMPTDMNSLYEVLVAFKTQDPNGNGVQDEIPLFGSERSTCGGDVINYLINLFLYFDDSKPFNVDANGKLYVPYTSDAYREALKFANKLYKEGLISQLSFTASNGDMRMVTTPASGTAIVGVFCGNLALHTTSNSEVLYEYAAMPYLDGQSVVYNTNIKKNVFITGDCEDVETAFAVLMKMWEEESSYRIRYGEYGVNWVEADEGAQSSYGLPADIKVINDPFGGQTTSNWGVNCGSLFAYAEGENVVKDGLSTWEIRRNQMHAQSAKNAAEAAAKNNPTNICPTLRYTEEELDQLSTIQSPCMDYMKKSRTSFITGKLDPNNDYDWENYILTMDGTGAYKWLEIAQTAYDRGAEF